MAKPGIAIEVSGNTEGVEAMLRALDTALNPVAIAGFLGAVVDPYLRKRASNRFRGEGDDVVGKWLPLSQATIDIRQQMGFGPGPINSRTGELEEFIVDSPNNINIHPWGSTLTLPGTKPQGELRVKVETAQGGKRWPSTPARPVLGMNMQDLSFVLLALAGHVEQVGKRLFR